jgi:hypothetical protein
MSGDHGNPAGIVACAIGERIVEALTKILLLHTILKTLYNRLPIQENRESVLQTECFITVPVCGMVGELIKILFQLHGIA